jgi:hypothetical protein
MLFAAFIGKRFPDTYLWPLVHANHNIIFEAE